jgi:hypothetical protein
MDTNNEAKKIKIFRVPIPIIIGNAAIKIIKGRSRFRNNVMNPIFLISFFEKGRVCNHLNEFPDMKELVETIPNIIIYKKVIPK